MDRRRRPGQVFNSFAPTGAFVLQDGSPSSFLFATEDGTISGWNSAAGTQSIIAVDEDRANPADGDEAQGVGAVYKGLAIADTDNGPMLYAANFRHGTVDVYDQNFSAVNSFTDNNLPAGYAPFNVQVLDGKLFVTFALQDDAKHGDMSPAPATASSTNSICRATCWRASRRVERSIHPGASPLRLRASVRLAAICWSAISATARSKRKPEE